MKIDVKKILMSLMVVGAAFCSSALADGMLEDTPPVRRKAKPVVQREMAPPPVERPRNVPVERPVANYTEPVNNCDWNNRMSAGAPVWFFEDEDTRPAAGLYFDTWNCDAPWNFRVGVEGRHMNLDQEAAEYGREWIDKTTKVTYMRIPFAVEYMEPVGEDTTWFVGGGPDIIHLANDISETDVGAHIGTRLHHGFDENWGVAIEAGYMWARFDGEGENINLDGAYVTPTLTYTF